MIRHGYACESHIVNGGSGSRYFGPLRRGVPQSVPFVYPGNQDRVTGKTSSALNCSSAWPFRMPMMAPEVPAMPPPRLRSNRTLERGPAPLPPLLLKSSDGTSSAENLALPESDAIQTPVEAVDNAQLSDQEVPQEMPVAQVIFENNLPTADDYGQLQKPSMQDEASTVGVVTTIGQDRREIKDTTEDQKVSDFQALSHVPPSEENAGSASAAPGDGTVGQDEPDLESDNPSLDQPDKLESQVIPTSSESSESSDVVLVPECLGGNDQGDLREAKASFKPAEAASDENVLLPTEERKADSDDVRSDEKDTSDENVPRSQVDQAHASDLTTLVATDIIKTASVVSSVDNVVSEARSAVCKAEIPASPQGKSDTSESKDQEEIEAKCEDSGQEVKVQEGPTELQ